MTRSPNRASPAERSVLVEPSADQVRLDWLEQHEVEVRIGLPYGSRHLFYAKTDDSFEGEIGPSDIRAKIDAAISSEAEASRAGAIEVEGGGK